MFRRTLTAAVAVTALSAVAAPSHAGVNLLVNGGFEASQLGAGQYDYPFGTQDGWYYWGSAIVNGEDGSAWWPNGDKPAGQEGDKFAALQTTSVIAQNFAIGATSLTLSWLDAGRPFSWGGCCNGDQTYQVLLYNYDTAAATTVGQYSTLSGQAFGRHTATVGGLAAGNYALVFQGLSSDRDETAFIDDVSAVAVPEPATWALMIMGFGLTGATLRRRQRALARVRA